MKLWGGFPPEGEQDGILEKIDNFHAELLEEHSYQILWRSNNILGKQNRGKNGRENQKEVITRLKPDFGHLQSLIKNVLIPFLGCSFFLHGGTY